MPALLSPAAAFRGLFVFTLVTVLAMTPVHSIAATSAPAVAHAAHTDPLNYDPLVRQGFDRFYNEDYNASLARFERVQSMHPGNPLATDYVLYVTLFRELFRLDLLDTTFYANDGFLTGKHTVVEDSKVRDRIIALAGQAIKEADAELRNNPNNTNALFARGWAESLQATYVAMVERGFVSALKLALAAKNDNTRVLHLDPDYADAKLVVGVYQYVVGALPFGFKLLMGVAGIHGSKSAGMALLRDSASRGVITNIESRTVMALFLRREAKYQEALAINHTLMAQYPHNFLFCLEHANLAKDAGEGMKAVAFYQQVIRQARQPGYFASAHVELAYFGLGASLRGQKLYQQSVEAFELAAIQPTTSPELKRRSLLAAGEDYDLMHQHSKASQEYQAVINAGRNTTQGELARKYQKNYFAGK